MAEDVPATPIRILMVEDSALDAELITLQLRRAGLPFTVERTWSDQGMRDALAAHDFDVILADHVLPGFSGDLALELAGALAPEVPFIFVSGTLSEELAVEALKRGARDYVVKSRLQRLPDAILRAINEAQERRRLLQVENELRESHQRLRLITDSLPALIAYLDRDHHYRFANQAYMEWHGLDPEAMVGRHAREMVGEEGFAALQEQLDKVLRGERVSFETLAHRRVGPPRHAQVDFVPELGPEGAVLGYYAMARDISELKHAQALLKASNESLERQVNERTSALHRSESRLQALFESSFQHQNLLTLDGHIIDTNSASLAAILATKDDVRGALYCESAWFASTEGVPAIVCQAVLEAAAGNASRHELDLLLPTGKRTFEFSFRPLLDHQGTITAVVSEAVETTARRQAEEALRQSQKIEAVGQLTGGIAHDFNNILTVIAGNVEYAKLLTERLGDVADGSTRALDNALKGVMRAANVTQRLLAFSRRQPLRSLPVDLNAQLRGMEDMLHRSLGELVQLEIVHHPDIWCVEVDPSQLEASVLNLAVNARDAMPEGGRLVIEVDNAHLDNDFTAQNPDVPPGHYAMLRVKDTGHGMSAETLTRVFEPFFTTKEVGRGTGLGLSMVYGFVKQSGGHVLVDSAPGAGTSITLLFPRSAAELPQAGQTEHRGLGGYEMQEEATVLVAEDNDDVRAYTVDTLRQLGYRVLEAHDGASAMRLLERTDVDVDLLFSDIVMPGMSGWELAKRALAHKPALRVLFTSGYPRDIDASGAVGRNIAILGKPFTRSDLARSIRGSLQDE
ncbi:hybrid sensor histidine kinase/response regulator [Stenotrophomonas rhizophila]|uniref:hybrid sensor histidine kinase/response regulator n=1 Tax=Stenotrophomonas rhizophila TaxID=216778 RepID=UPI000BA72DE7|nr:hybrid sensor histidine kinase/response regulator [Stenotrophomonas rhizophila]PAK93353.1 hybrid sensor histidine kinase/response regulator [Stenotrophomonas rhizophila]UQY87223.1 PAS domain-containing protein [Stenotrophomonas rhizophila]